MFLTNILLKKVKSKYALVLLESMSGSGHTYVARRERLADKLEVERFDPKVQANVLYKEKKRIKSI